MLRNCTSAATAMLAQMVVVSSKQGATAKHCSPPASSDSLPLPSDQQSCIIFCMSTPEIISIKHDLFYLTPTKPPFLLYRCFSALAAAYLLISLLLLQCTQTHAQQDPNKMCGFAPNLPCCPGVPGKTEPFCHNNMVCEQAPGTGNQGDTQLLCGCAC